MKKLKISFELPPPQGIVLDDKVNAYIEKLKAESEFTGPLNIKIDDFEGPLDLLLFLVKQAKVKIEDIFISRITDQYLSLMRDLNETDLEKASEFISIAAILLEIKSKALLPKNEFEPVEAVDAKKELIRKLEEYKIYKEAGEKMRALESTGVFFKSPDPSVADTHIILKDMTMSGLLAAMQKLFLKMEQRGLTVPPRKITRDRFTVADRIGHLKDIMTIRTEVNFFELFDSSFSVSEIIITFLALLELLKMQAVYAEQKESFSDIVIKLKNPVGQWERYNDGN